MKFIRKRGAPHQYRKWRRDVAGTNKEDYREISSDMKAIVLLTLLKEQGGICAYTMKRIDADTSHIEHVKPEVLCRNDTKGSDLDFQNMIACFPRDGMPRSCRYGAQKKDQWWDAAMFVSPLDPACEHRFRFNLEGEISSVGANEAARRTIKVLALDHQTLVEERRRAMHEIIYGMNGDDPLSRAEAVRLEQRVCESTGGRFSEFCVALRDALRQYIEYIEKLARKRQFVRRATR